MGNITKNFSFSDFRPKGSGEDWTPQSEYQRTLITKIAESIETVMSSLPRGVRVEIAKGVVTPSQNNIESDYEHFYGVSAQTPKHLISSFGEVYQMSQGAVNIHIKGMKTTDAYQKFVEANVRCRSKFGTIVLHWKYEDRKPWIHLTNDCHDIYGPFIGTMLNKPKYTYTKDGGETFHEYGHDNRKYRGRQFE